MEKTKYVISRKQFILNFIGNLCNALLSMILLVFVIRSGQGNRISDAFTLVFSISQMFLTIATFQVRMFQATDVVERFSLGDYINFRCVTTTVMIAVTVGYLIVNKIQGLTLELFCMFTILRIIEAFSDVYYGYFQQRMRIEITGCSLILKNIISMIFFGFFINLTDIRQAMLSVILVYLVVFIFWDSRKIKTMNDMVKFHVLNSIPQVFLLFKECIPLFLNSFLAMLLYNIPRITIEELTTGRLLESGTQTIYNILYMPTNVMNLFVVILGPIFTVLAFKWKNREIDIYNNHLKKLFLLLLMSIMIFLFGAFYIGMPILSNIYLYNLEKYKSSFLIMLIGGCISALIYVFANLITVIRGQKYLTIIYIITVSFGMIVADNWVIKYKIDGAALIYVCEMLMLLIGHALIYLIIYMKNRKLR